MLHQPGLAAADRLQPGQRCRSGCLTDPRLGQGRRQGVAAGFAIEECLQHFIDRLTFGNHAGAKRGGFRQVQAGETFQPGDPQPGRGIAADQLGQALGFVRAQCAQGAHGSQTRGLCCAIRERECCRDVLQLGDPPARDQAKRLHPQPFVCALERGVQNDLQVALRFFVAAGRSECLPRRRLTGRRKMEARFKNLPQLCRATERGDAPENPGQPVGADFLRLGQVHQAGEHLFGAAFLEHGKHRAGVLGEV